MYDNLTADDIIDVWSDVYLRHAIAPQPLPFEIDLRCELMMANNRKRPFTSITAQ